MSNPELDNLVDNSATEVAANDPEVTLTLKLQEVNVIIAGLQDLPHRVVDTLLRSIVSQAQSQLHK
jgi:hypothetical protein